MFRQNLNTWCALQSSDRRCCCSSCIFWRECWLPQKIASRWSWGYCLITIKAYPLLLFAYMYVALIVLNLFFLISFFYRSHIPFLSHSIKLEISNIMMETLKLQDLTIPSLWMSGAMRSRIVQMSHHRLATAFTMCAYDLHIWYELLFSYAKCRLIWIPSLTCKT